MMDQTTKRKKEQFLAAVTRQPCVMGILNVTPDSFSDGGQYIAPDKAIDKAQRMAREGAAIIDIGAESTRPNATEISDSEEITRLTPLLAPICQDLDIAVSIDTYKASTARWAVGQGVAIINDIWGLQGDADMASTVKDTGAGIIIMHNRHHEDPSIDILEDIERFFEASLERADKAGIAHTDIILDPGIGFKKTVSQNYDILQNLQTLTSFGYPLLLGLSRKRMIGEVLSVNLEARLAGTLAANTLGLDRGADLLRVHDVAPHIHAIEIFNAMKAAKC